MRLPNSATTTLSPRGRYRSFRRELSRKNLTFVIVFACITALAAVSYAAVALIKARRRQRKDAQKAKQAGRWSLLNALLARKKKRGQGSYEQASGFNFNGTSQTHPLESPSSHGRQTTEQTHVEPTPHDAIRVERNLSIRSVMTLPAYRAFAAQDERVMGRAGERGGVDIIVALPTADEQESLRDEEMEAIYQIRLARRQRAAEREEFRRQRQNAQQSGGSNAPSEVRSQSRTAGYDHAVRELRQDVSRIQEQRQRSVSSVSYGDLGVASHNGTRLRASSIESERMGLLAGAASFAMPTLHDAHLPLPGLHRRDRSASSLLSIDRELHAVRCPSALPSQPTTTALSCREVDASWRPEPVEVGLADEPPRPPEYESVSGENMATGTADNWTGCPPPPYVICCGVRDSEYPPYAPAHGIH